MSPQEYKAIARRFLEDAFPQGQFEPILAPGYQDHNAPPGTRPGPAGIVQITEPYRQAFPDLHFTVEDQVAEGDKVVTRFVFHGTHRGSLMGIPPTGRQVHMEGISIYRIADGQMQEAWVQYDILGLLQQLGAFPPALAAAG
jgi:steroid delta-isomerase-like uncharacterized protein